LRGDVYRLNKQWDEALKDADTAIGLDAKLPRAYQVKGRVYAERKEYHEAVAAFTKVIDLAPSYPNALVARGDAYAEDRNYRAALTDFRQAVKRFPKSARTHDGLAWFLATCPEARWRDGRQAVSEATLACVLSNWKDANNLDSLAAALAETGDFDQATRRAEQALKQPLLDDRERWKNILLRTVSESPGASCHSSSAIAAACFRSNGRRLTRRNCNADLRH
jgi:tetratricopeptide (TPR) repeat protein